MNLIELFLEDHRLLKGYLEKIHDLDQRDLHLTSQLFIQLQKILDRHTYGEEQFLYPKTKANPQLRPDTLEGFEEHRLVGHVTSEIKQIPFTDDRRVAKLKVLREVLTSHLEEEEGLFPDVLKEMDPYDLNELAQRAVKSRSRP